MKNFISSKEKQESRQAGQSWLLARGSGEEGEIQSCGMQWRLASSSVGLGDRYFRKHTLLVACWKERKGVSKSRRPLLYGLGKSAVSAPMEGLPPGHFPQQQGTAYNLS